MVVCHGLAACEGWLAYLSATMASTSSRVWKAVASSAARAMCALLANAVSPTSTPLASGRQCGAKSPEKAAAGCGQARARAGGKADRGREAAVSPGHAARAARTGHEVDVPIVRHRLGQVLHLRCCADHTEVVAQPLHERARNRHAALQRVDGRRVAQAEGNGG